jgi:hypothetical protein
MSYIVMRKIPDSEDRAFLSGNSYDSFDIHSSGDWEAISSQMDELDHARHILRLFRESYRTGAKLYLFQVMEDDS